jgi:hypothetical protein
MTRLRISGLCVAAVLFVASAGAEDLTPPPIAERFAVALMLLHEQADAAASVPFFRSCEVELAGRWEFHLNYGAALMSASSQAIEVEGRKEAIVRSSHERMSFLKQAMVQFQLAERGAPNSEVRASCIASQGKLLAWVGSPIDALEQYQRAAELSGAYLRAVALTMMTMADPCSAKTVVTK